MKTKIVNKLIYPELSYRLNGLLYAVHNKLGRYCREKQYADELELFLKTEGLAFEREKALKLDGTKNYQSADRVDFVIDNKILLDCKAKRLVTKEDYYQIQRYLQISNFKLGLLVNFRSKYLKPIRIIRIGSTN